MKVKIEKYTTKKFYFVSDNVIIDTKDYPELEDLETKEAVLSYIDEHYCSLESEDGTTIYDKILEADRKREAICLDDEDYYLTMELR